MIVRSPVVRESAPARQRARRSAWPLVALLAGLAIAAIVAGFLLIDGSSSGSGKKHSGASIKLSAVAAYDPYGDRTENDDLIGNATDGNPATFWPTEHYYSGLAALKPGVGLVLNARKSSKPSAVTVLTKGAAFHARIETGDSLGGPFHIASKTISVSGTTKFELLRAVPARYFVVWITEVSGGRAEINEVKAS